MGETAFMIALKNLNSLEIIKCFIDSGVNAKETNNEGESALLFAL